MRSRSLSTSVVILWNLSQPALWWTIPAIEAIESREPTVKRFKAMQVKDGIRRTSLSLLLNSAVKWPTSFIIYGQTPEIGNFTLTAGCSQRVVVVVGGGGGYWSRFMENKMAVSHFTDNKFGISRFKRKKIFIRSVLLILVKNYSQRTALFDVPTILPLLVLGAVKRKPSSLFRSWGSAPSSNTEKLSSEGSLWYWELVCFRNSRWRSIFSFIILWHFNVTVHDEFNTRNSFHRLLLSKITAHDDYQFNSWVIKPAIHGSRKYPLPPSSHLTFSFQ